jgi:hypothetical protein
MASYRRTRTAKSNTQKNGTINLAESDNESVILDSPLEKAFTRSLSEDSIIYVGDTRIKRTPSKRRKLSSVSSDASTSVIIDDEPSPKPPVTTTKCEPEIEADFISLKTVFFYKFMAEKCLNIIIVGSSVQTTN